MPRPQRPAAASDPRARGRAAKQRRLDGADRQRARFPWLMPLIVVVAVAIVVVGAIWAIALGHFF
jgi:cobalamin biosynthesis Mg chelatase CobN